MRIRSSILVTVLALVIAACGGGSTDTTQSESTTTTLGTPEAVQLAYSLSAGDTYTYEVDMDQTISMNIEGDPSALAETEGEEVPQQMDVHVTGTTTFTHTIADGPEPGTYEITITGDFSDLDFEGTVDGEPITDEGQKIPDLAETGPVDVTIVVDDKGNIINDPLGAGGEDILGALGGSDLFGMFGPSSGTDQLVGPPFSDEDVTVGDTWSETVEIPSLPDSEPVTTNIDSEVVGVEEIDGSEVFVIETNTTTSAIDFDLADFLVGFMSAFAPEDATDDELEQMNSAMDDLRFAFSVDPQSAEMTTWFDHEAGLAKKTDYTNSTHLRMDLSIPDQTTGELAEMTMDMTIDQDVEYRLVSAETA